MSPFTPQEQQFINNNLTADIPALLLRYQGNDRQRWVIEQIATRQKIRKKVPGWYGHTGLILPNGLPLEQASSQATAELKSQELSGTHLLDITGGLGVDCYYLSSNFTHTTYVERDPELTALAKHNFAVLGANIEVKTGDGLVYLEQNPTEVVYLDPHRRDAVRKKQVALSSYQPDITAHLNLLTQNSQLALVKVSPMLSLSEAEKLLTGYLAEIWVISYRNECKEVLLHLRSDAEPDRLEVRCFNHNGHRWQHNRAPLHHGIRLEYSLPETYLYEPNASLLKAGIQDKVAAEFHLAKLHPQSHFYTSLQRLPDFPGRSFELRESLKPWHPSLKKTRYNIISRNFPERADRIAQRLRIKPAGDDFLIATRLIDQTYHFLIATLLDAKD